MSNRNFDSRVIIQRLQDQNRARNLYQYNINGLAIVNNPQTSDSGAGRINTFHSGSETMYFKGLLGGYVTSSLGATLDFRNSNINIPTPITVPNPPFITNILGGNSSLNVNFISSLLPGFPALFYEYSTSGIPFSSIGGTTSPFTILGLTNGLLYPVVMRGVNAAGPGDISNEVNGTPFTIPDAPNITNIVAGNSILSVNYTAPFFNGGSTISDYEYSTIGIPFSSIGGTTSPFTILGLTNGTTYPVVMRGVNAAGPGAISNEVSGTPNIYGWATNIGGTGQDQGNGITTDTFGNVYLTGFFNISTVINSFSSISSNSTILTISSGKLIGNGSDDAYIAKYTSSGMLQWATNIGGIGSDSGQGIITDTLGNVYTTGIFNNTAIINSFSNISSNSTIQTISSGILTGSGGTDAYIAKYTSSGMLQWATNIGGVGSDQGNGITTDIFGNVYTTGFFGSSTIVNSFSSISSNSTILTISSGKLIGSGGTDAYIAKYTSSGMLQWATNIGGSLNNDQGRGIITDTLGNVYTTGSFNTTAIINSFSTISSGTIRTISSGILSGSGGTDTYIAKYTSSGMLQWATNIGGTVSDFGQGITIDTLGSVYVTGFYNTTININSFSSILSGNIIQTITSGKLTGIGGNDAYIAKYTSSGMLQWATNIGGTFSDSGLGIITDTLGNVYATGSFTISTIINSFSSILSNSTIQTISSGKLIGGADDAYIAKYTSSGMLQWATNIGGTSSDQGLGIITDTNGNIYATGYFIGSAVINSFSSILPNSTIQTISSGILFGSIRDTYIVKYNPNGQIIFPPP